MVTSLDQCGNLEYVLEEFELEGAMSTPLIAVAAILAVFALVLIPLMMMKGGEEESHAQQQDHPAHQGRRFTKKKKKRK
ncbi:hypothetical protein [Geomonas ferrireducens]|uniref:hypothetical protein n=2 Tax=Geobacteraceae TaxID=213422 RepID=UPI0010A93D12|nr:hypothetical protein [Geomonas ferrireducens]